MIKAITLYQPWATLVAIGAKRFETRDWGPEDYRGPLAIHAGKKTDNLARFWDDPFCEVLKAAGYDGPEDLALGAVVCVASLDEVLDTNLDATILSVAKLPHEGDFGDFGPGRWAWALSNVKRIEPPITARGYQKLWDWDAPPEVMALLG